jgi:predicted RNase H-like HicB family nuclease
MSSPIGMSMNIIVKAIWDAEAAVWVATSDDVPGLVTEAETFEELDKKLRVMIPELLIENGVISGCDHPSIPFHLLAERDSVAKVC